VDEFHSNSESLGVSCSSLQPDEEEEEEEQQQQLGHGIIPHKFPNKSNLEYFERFRESSYTPFLSYLNCR
jgi:hypothetical protein